MKKKGGFLEEVMNKKKIRIITIGIAMVLGLSIISCDNTKDSDENFDKAEISETNTKQNTKEEEKDYVYVKKSIPIEEIYEIDKADRYAPIHLAEAGVYVIGEFDEPYHCELHEITLEKDGIGTNRKAMEFRSRWLTYTMDGQGNIYAFEVKTDENNTDPNAGTGVFDRDGNPVDLREIDPNTYLDEINNGNLKIVAPEYQLVKYSPTGEELYRKDTDAIIAGRTGFYPSFFLANERGELYFYIQGEGFSLIDKNGELKGRVEEKSSVCAAGIRRNGNLLFYSFGGASYTNEVMREIEFDSAKVVNTYSNSMNVNGTIYEYEDGKLLFRNYLGIYSYDLTNNESDMLLSWNDLGIDYGYVEEVYFNKDHFTVIMYDDQYTEHEIVMINKVSSEELAEKEIITLGMLYEDASVSKEIIRFNESSDKYRIVVKTYLDLATTRDPDAYSNAVERLNNDMIAGQCPDILDVSGLDINNLMEKGVLEDLTPYLDNSAYISKNDFLEGILEKSIFDGKIAFVSGRFSLQTYAGKTKLVGNKEGMSIADVVALSKAYPDKKLYDRYYDMNLLNVVLQLNEKKFVDWENRTSHFDSQEFKDLMEYAKTLPSQEEEERTHDKRAIPYQLQEDDVILTQAYIYDYERLQFILKFFGDEEVTFVGYPCEDGSNGCMLNLSKCFAISAGSAYKQEAWEFIENLIRQKSEKKSFDGFSTLKNLFDEEAQEKLNEKYVTNEDGELILDKEGNPILENRDSSYSISGEDGVEWTVKIDRLTQQQVDIIRDLAKNATREELHSEDKITQIVLEESGAYFSGDKSLDEVISIIQNRVNLYLKEL